MGSLVETVLDALGNLGFGNHAVHAWSALCLEMQIVL